ncbi:MAG: hypothetical protein ACO1OQ_11565 [Rufibacter sp.]
MNGKLIYKRWLNTGVSKVFDVMAYDKYTLTSLRDYEVDKSTFCFISVKAKLKLKSTEEGGRYNWVQSGYRPNHVFEYTSNGAFKTYIGEVILEEDDFILPGEEKKVRVNFLLEQPIEKYINVGRKWWIHEGRKVVGEGEILDIQLV